MIKLSIVIPTLNSGAVLDETLSALLPQASQFNEVDVLVINNGSTDNTQDIINKYHALYPEDLKFYQRKGTIPAMDNFADGVHRVEGEFVFLLGDDDIVFPSFIQEILPLLKGEIGLIHFNRVMGLNNLSESKSLYRNVGIDGVMQYDNYKEFLSEYTCEFNFMSSVVFKRDVWMRGEKSAPQKNSYYGYLWYAYLVFGAMNTSCVYYPYPLVIQRVVNRSWHSDWPLFWIVGMFTIYQDLDSKLPGIYQQFYEIQHDKKKDLFISLFSIIAKEKRKYRGHRDEFFRVLNSREKVLFKVVTNTPSIIGCISQKIYRLLGF